MSDPEQTGMNGKSSVKVVGESVGEITEKVTLLVHEEIELAKAEVSAKLTRLGAGVVIGLAAGIFIVFGIFGAVNALGWGMAELFNHSVWIGFLIMACAMFVIAAVAGLIAAVLLKRSSPVPEMAIEEARKTKDLIGSGDEHV